MNFLLFQDRKEQHAQQNNCHSGEVRGLARRMARAMD